ncbi:MAG TPA: hypothetical protein VIF57_19495 [Polyangia bacterium]
MSTLAFGVLVVFATTALRPAVAETRLPAAAAPPAEDAAYPQVPAHRQLTMVHKRRTGAILAGAVIFGISYGLALGLSGAMFASDCCNGSMAIDFAIPVIGPVAGGPSADSGLMMFWSGAQLLGAVLLGYGIKGEDVPETRDVPPTHVARPAPELQLTPLLARGASGMALTARW